MLLPLCVFLAVSSATLLIYFALTKGTGRGAMRRGKPADPDFDPVSGLPSFKSPATKPAYFEPASTGVADGFKGLRILIPLAVVALLVGCMWQAVRVEIRRRFDEVISKITSDHQFSTDLFSKNGNNKLPDFRVQPLQPAPFRLEGLGRVQMPTGPRTGVTPAPARSSFRFR
jgi:hypothetical protein